MARLFNGTSDKLVSASTIDLTAFNKLSVAFWLWWDAYSSNDATAITTSPDWFNNVGTFIVDPNYSGTANVFISVRGNVAGSGQTIPRPSAAAWHHYVCILDFTQAGTAEVTTVYVDGVSQTLTNTGTNNNTGNFGDWAFNVMSMISAGRMAELAVWGGNLLSSGDATALFNGSKLPSDPSLSIGAATHYWKVCGVDSPELPTLGGVNLTVTGTSQTPHPPNVTASCATFPGGSSLPNLGTGLYSPVVQGFGY